MLERENMLLPQSATLTAPSEKEPDNFLSDSFDFHPLSLASFDSSPKRRAEKIISLSRKYSSESREKSTCLALWERWRFRRNLRRGLSLPQRRSLIIPLSMYSAEKRKLPFCDLQRVYHRKRSFSI